jgi:hypothetical protein
MKLRTPRLLLVLTLTLPVAAAAVLVADMASSAQRELKAREFQGLVGGLGFGPAADLSACAFSFDPRLCPGCAMEHGPVLGGAYFCPYHSCAILYYPRLETLDPRPPANHASVP